MNAKVLFTAFLCALIAVKAWTAPVKIYGKAPEYAQNTFNLNTFHDFISEEEIKLGTIRFNASGVFNLEIEINETTLVFADFDGYHGMIYLEPGKSYEIVLPPKRTLTESQKRNPFEKPQPVWFGIINPAKDELNFQIQQFEEEYTICEDKYFNQIFINRTSSLVDTVKQILDKKLPKTKSDFFESHKQFRKANLEFALHQGKSTNFMNSYFSAIIPKYNLAAYSTLFNQVFQNYFNTLTNSSNNNEIQNFIGTSSLAKLDEYLQKQLHFNRQLSHWILLKSMKDAYYCKQFQKASILEMLDQVKILGWSTYEQTTAQLIRAKLTHLASGTIPPALVLKNINGQKVSFSDYPNKYIYLHFTDPKNTICRQHLDALKTIASHYKDKLVIINVIHDHAALKNENEWAGIFTTTESDLQATYKVKTYPNSFLIGKDGKLLFSPAPNPIDGLDRQLGQLFKSEYIKELQKANNRQPK